MTQLDLDEVTDEVESDLSRTYARIAQQMLELFPTIIAKGLRSVEEYQKLDIESGDIVICYASDGETPELAWILFGSHGKCELMGDSQTEDIDWFFRFGAVDIIRK